MYGENYDLKLDLPQLFESESFRIYSLESINQGRLEHEAGR